MKLSKKGIDRLYAQVWINQEDLPQDEIFGFETLEFQSDDFEDCVILSIEEAKTFLNMTKVLKFCAQISKNKHFGHLKDLEKVLTNRIERALIAKICEDFNEDLNKALAEFQKQAEKENETK